MTLYRLSLDVPEAKLNKTQDDDNYVTWYKNIDEEGKFLCKFCNSCYSTVQTIRWHVKTKHSTEAEHIKKQLSARKRNGPSKCHICGLTFQLLEHLISHINREHDFKNINLSCKYCNAVFENMDQLKCHLANGHKKLFTEHTCKTCGYRTSKISHFKQHQNTHNKENAKKCSYCDYSTNHLPNLKVHEYIHLDIKPYDCDFKQCNYKSASKSALKSHQLQHNREDNMLF